MENYSNSFLFLLLSVSILFLLLEEKQATTQQFCDKMLFESNHFEGKYGVIRYKVRNKVCLFISILHAYKHIASYFAARYA